MFKNLQRPRRTVQDCCVKHSFELGNNRLFRLKYLSPTGTNAINQLLNPVVMCAAEHDDIGTFVEYLFDLLFNKLFVDLIMLNHVRPLATVRF